MARLNIPKKISVVLPQNNLLGQQIAQRLTTAPASTPKETVAVKTVSVPTSQGSTPVKVVTVTSPSTKGQPKTVEEPRVPVKVIGSTKLPTTELYMPFPLGWPWPGGIGGISAIFDPNKTAAEIGLKLATPTQPTPNTVLQIYQPGVGLYDPLYGAGVTPQEKQTYETNIYQGAAEQYGTVPDLLDILGPLKDLGKWILIAGGVLIGAWIISSYLKGRNK
jgi:hypothetical protein